VDGKILTMRKIMDVKKEIYFWNIVDAHGSKHRIKAIGLIRNDSTYAFYDESNATIALFESPVSAVRGCILPDET
jgi:hypothetical protein